MMTRYEKLVFARETRARRFGFGLGLFCGIAFGWVAGRMLP